MRCYLLLSSLLLVNYNTAAADLDAMQAAIDAGRAAEIVSGLAAAADGGDAAAQTLLAGLYQRGEGVDKDFSRALRLYLAAAERGNAEAQFNLGNMYLLGEGVKADEVWAMTYYRQAAVQGHALA